MDALSGAKGAKGQQQASNAASQAYSAEEQAIGQLMSQYFANAPKFLSSGYGLMDQLKNFPASQQPEIQQLSNVLGNSNLSQLASLRNQLGGTANPNALAASMQAGNRQNQAAAVQGMQSQLAGQDLQALGQEGNVLSDIGSFLSAPVGAGLSGLQNIGNTYSQIAGAGGNPWNAAIGSLGGLAGNSKGAGKSSGSNALSTGTTPGSQWDYQPSGSVTGSLGALTQDSASLNPFGVSNSSSYGGPASDPYGFGQRGYYPGSSSPVPNYGG